MINKYISKKKRREYVITRVTTSLAAIASISAQETVLGQDCSSLVLASSITSNAASDKFGGPSFSALLFAVESNNTDASQPYNKKNI